MTETWTTCVTGTTYSVIIDWNSDNAVTGTGDNVTADVLGDGTWTSGYGRDQSRQLSPSRIGTAAWTLCNASRIYSPENVDSPIADDIGPGRETSFDVTFDDTDYALFRGRIDDFNVRSGFTDRNADFTALDGLAELQNIQLSTAVYRGLRTGDIITLILDAVGWPADQRDIDVGASFTRFWWAEDTDAYAAVQDMVAAEGPPSIAYVAPDGTFRFRDRHHRLLDPLSLTSQATFSAQPLNTCCSVEGYGTGGYGECGYGD